MEYLRTTVGRALRNFALGISGVAFAFVLLMVMVLLRTEEQAETADVVKLFQNLTLEQKRQLIDDGLKNGWLNDALMATRNDDGSKGFEAVMNTLPDNKRWDLQEITREGNLSDAIETLKQLEAAADLVSDSEIKDLLVRARAMSPEERLAFDQLTGDGELQKAANVLERLQQGEILVEEAEIVQLAEAISALPKARRVAFQKLFSTEGYQEIINWAYQIARMIDEGKSLEDLQNALALAESLSPEELSNTEELKRRIRATIDDTRRIGEDLAREIEAATGDIVRGVGGEIDQRTGAVTVPDALFDRGKHDLNPKLSAFLRAFCPPWLESLVGFDNRIAAIRIEGHASSEWRTGTNEIEAYLKNMDLSQRRASTVLAECLRLISDSPALLWSRQRIASIGYSSSHPVRHDGVEDPSRSRRVVFRVEIDATRVINEINAEVQDAVAGPARVIGGDTIWVGTTKIRLQGVSTPELDEPLGLKAKDFMSKLLNGKQVTCKPDGTVSFDRRVATCFLDGEDIAIPLVREGLARDCPKFSKGRYSTIEKADASKLIQLPDYCSEG